MKFCSNCGSQNLSFKMPDGDHRPRIICEACRSTFYSNPKIIVGCLPVWEDKVMLCRRNIEPRKGFWNVPGGFMENKETVEEGAIRELWEEAGAKVNIKGLLTVYNLLHVNQVYFHFWGELESLDYEMGHETQEVKLFIESEIPWHEIAFESTNHCLKAYFENRREHKNEVHFGEFGRQFGIFILYLSKDKETGEIDSLQILQNFTQEAEAEKYFYAQDMQTNLNHHIALVREGGLFYDIHNQLLFDHDVLNRYLNKNAISLHQLFQKKNG